MWIRSQDKMNLVKIRQISLNYQNNKQIIANYTPELYENSGGYYELLGTYKTKERALEVLDEIQKLLIPKIIIKNEGRDCVALDGTIYRTNIVSNINSDIQQLSTYVYEMPEK